VRKTVEKAGQKPSKLLKLLNNALKKTRAFDRFVTKALKHEMISRELAEQVMADVDITVQAINGVISQPPF
jgi:hypothetical protein